MNTQSSTPLTVDDYIDQASPQVQEILQTIRRTIQEAAPLAAESVSYGMPAYKLNDKPLVYFGAFARHIGFYGTPQTHEAFVAELSKYKQGKGSAQFALSNPIPYELIEKMVRYRANTL